MNEKNGISPLLLSPLSPRHMNERDLIELEMNDLKIIQISTLPNMPAWDFKTPLGNAYFNGVLAHVNAGFVQNDSKEWVGQIDVLVKHKIVGSKKITATTLYDLKTQIEGYIDDVIATLENALKELE